jgi:hypothetical protein
MTVEAGGITSDSGVNVAAGVASIVGTTTVRTPQ